MADLMRSLFFVAACIAIAGCAPPARLPAPQAFEQLAHFNHAFATVDAETAAAIERSEFLRRFANVEVRTTTGTASTWTGRYLYGRTTYFEFFAPGDFQIEGKQAPPGSWGIAVSGDRVGDAQKLRSRIEAAGNRAVVELDTRTFGERKVPWFTAVTAISPHGDSGGRNEAVSVWAMEYEPSYLDLPDVAKEAPEGPEDIVSRERYQSDLYREKMMRDVERVEFDIPVADFRRIEPILRAAGFRISQLPGRVLADGDETDLLFNLTSAGMRLRQVQFALNAPVTPHVEKIGRSRLTVGPNATATWVFD